ncbi:transcriptional attenuator, LytR family [Clostridium collagenovorans DSM 3089]|uniref:Transcriptional attenuator, LytR family n=1 Tax=Clostridium collagenovorans DSM 3089 TaxID=1121306 RepID=A0A1M5UWG9_9CLOT|nr:LCP family protein [Clostridium collagenovorans]SHH67260.1 transcriptional attenuator, LytR family [Clostridium collagenovorans DSM 3089]
MKKKTKKTLIITGISILIAMAVVVASGFGYLYYQLSKIESEPITKEPEELAITKETEEKSKQEDIINIALFGIDARDLEGNDPSRSDAIMVLSIDKKDKTIRLSSIMRDTYVTIKGREGKDKLNHAYAFGQGELAINTINSNFNLDIKDYISVNFYGLEKIVDRLGGVTIDVKQEEIQYINSMASGMASAEGKTVKPISAPGPQTLNGIQAVAYGRIRSTAGGDYVRTDRQRTVLMAAINKCLKTSPMEMYSVATELIPYVKTSMSPSSILSLGKDILLSGVSNVEENRFPLQDKCKGDLINGVSYIITDLNETSKDIHKFIYGEE